MCFMQYVHFSNRMILGSLGRVVRGPDVYVSPGVEAIIVFEELSDMCKVYGVLRLGRFSSGIVNCLYTSVSRTDQTP